MEQSGDKIGRWTLLKERTLGDKPAWKCRCECGEKRVVLRQSLRSGRSKSCGCLALELSTQHGLTGSPTWNSWKSMHDRCSRKGNASYPRYGARGIRVCTRWAQFESFLQDMGLRPEGTELDRKDNDGNYTPSNCRWVTKRKNNNNKSNNVKVFYKGKEISIMQLSRKTGISASTLYSRKRRGIPVFASEDAVDIARMRR